MRLSTSFKYQQAMLPSQQITLYNFEKMHFAVSRQRAKAVLAYEAKRMGSIEEYFDKLMKRRHESETGVINLPRRNFEDVLNKYVKSEEDYEQLLAAFYNYLGHRNTFPQKTTDALLNKALQLQKPELAYPLIGYHAELLIHPHFKVMQRFMNKVVAAEDYD